MVRFFLSGLLVGLTGMLTAQPSEIFGRIQDQANGRPIEFVNVFFQTNQGRGVISNEKGEFRIKFGLEDRKDTLVFSELGYEPVFLAVGDIRKDTIRVLMEEQSLPLPEVTVFSDEHLRAIVREALSRLPDQYGHKNTWLQSYYREYSITDNRYSEMLEAFVTIEDGRFSYPPRDASVFLEEFRRSLDRRNVPEEKLRGYDNGIYNLYERFPYVLSRVANLFERKQESFLNHYRFFNHGEYLEGADTLIAIGFVFSNPRVRDAGLKDEPYRKGELVIRKSDFGILKWRQGDPKEDSYSEVTYQKVRGKYFPKRIQLVQSLSFDNGRRFYLNARQIHVLQVYLPDDRKGKKIRKGRYVRPELGMRDIRYSYNEAFWDSNRMLVRIPAPDALQVDIAKRGELEDQFYQTSRNKKRN